MEFLIALMNIDPAHLVVGALGVVALRGLASSESSVEDDNSDYEIASWNPSSVNYNG